MPELSVVIDGIRQNITFGSSETSVPLKELLENHGVAVASECGGVGKCGFCIVKVASGLCSPLTFAEQSTLSEDEISEAYRLSCQVKPLGDVALIIGES